MRADNEQTLADPLSTSKTLTRQLAERCRDALQQVPKETSLRDLSPGIVARSMKKGISPVTPEWGNLVLSCTNGQRTQVAYSLTRVEPLGIKTLDQLNIAKDEVLDHPFVGKTRSAFLKSIRNAGI